MPRIGLKMGLALLSKTWPKVGLAVMIGLGFSLAAFSPALAWGPVTHQKIIADAVRDLEPGGLKWLWTNYPAYAYGGAIVPDWCLAYSIIQEGELAALAPCHERFHSPEYLDALRVAVITPGELAFYYAYAAHVRADADEAAFGAQVTERPSGVALEYYVDRMVQSEGYPGEVDIAICSGLMVRAYRAAFPDAAECPTASQIDTLSGANWIYQRFWLGEVAEIDLAAGYLDYGDYPGFVAAEVARLTGY